MDNFELTLSLNTEQLKANVHLHTIGNITYYDILFEAYSISIYKDTLYTWTSDDPHGLSQADIQSLGEQLDNRK